MKSLKTLVCALVCLSTVVGFADVMRERPKLPPGFRNPALLPPGPEREAAEKLVQEHLRASREWGREMMAQRRAAEKPDPLKLEIKAATGPDGTIDHSKMSREASDRLDALALASIVESAARGPSQRLIAIVGDRPKKDLERITEAVGEVSLQLRVRQYPFESVARTVRQLVGDDIKLTDDQIRALLSARATPLWRRDQ